MKYRLFKVIGIIFILAGLGFGCTYFKHKHIISRGGSYYTVKKGDTLSKLSKRFNVSVDDIYVANLLDSKNEIYAGQEIFIPNRKKISGGTYLADNKKRPKTKKKKKSGKKNRNFFKIFSDEQPKLTKFLKKISLKWPIKGTITSKFGVKRSKRRHNGIDIANKLGANIRAAAAGKVIYSDNKLRYYGKVVIIKNARNWFTVYAHNRENLVSEGDWVKQGQKIAKLGKTGRATGPHLHFEVRKGKVPVNPLLYLPK